MSKGYWLHRVDGIFATQKKPFQFDKMSLTLPRRGTNTKNREYFVPEFECTEDFRAKNIPVEEQLDNATLDELVANVDFNVDQQTEDLNKALKKARIEKTQADTKLVGEKLDERKKQLFYDWSERFFDSFADHFAKLKNTIVEMHLNEEQVKNFKQTLDKCLQNMRNDLNGIYDEFMQEKENED